MPNDADNQDQQNNADNQDQQNNDQKNQADAFIKLLDPDMQQNPSITKFKDVKELAKSYVELQKLVGADKIKVPTEKSTPEEWDAFFKKVGKPEKETDYDVNDEDLPEGLRTDAATKDSFRKAMHAQGFSKKQFEAAWKFYKESTANRFNQELAEVEKLKSTAETTLRKKWGAAYEGKVDKAQQFINKFFKGKNIHKAFNALSSDVGFIEAMSDAAEAISEDVLNGGTRTTMTPAEAQSEINSMMMDAKHPLNNDLHPEHQAAVDRLLELRTLVEAGNNKG